MDPDFRALMAAELAEEGNNPTLVGGPSAPEKTAAAAVEPPVAPQAAGGQRGSLIMFEGADLLLEEDRGFISVLSDLIEDSKVGKHRSHRPSLCFKL